MLIGRALRGPPRQGPAVRQVRRPARPGRELDRLRRPPGGGQELPGLHPETPRRRPHRHLPPGAPRPRRAHRGHDRRHRRHGQGRLRPRHRPLRGRAGDHPPGARRPPDRRPADRVLADQPRPRGRRSSRCSPSSASASPPTACSRAACSAAPSPSRTGDFRAHLPALHRRERRAEPAPGRGPGGARRREGVTPTQLAIAWVLAKGKSIVPVIGARTRDAAHRIARRAPGRAVARRPRPHRRGRPRLRRRRHPLRRAPDADAGQREIIVQAST